MTPILKSSFPYIIMIGLLVLTLCTHERDQTVSQEQLNKSDSTENVLVGPKQVTTQTLENG